MIIVNFPNGVNKVTAQPLYQWNYGQKLKITGAGVQVCQVHFCDRTCDETIVRIAGVSADATGLEVAIPDRLLENEYDINAFIYECGDESGQTLKHIIIPVLKRKRPEETIDIVPDSIQTQMEEMLANANSAISTIQSYYGATLTFGELYQLVKDEVTTQIDDINDITGEYWGAVEQVKEEHEELTKECKKIEQKLDKYQAETDKKINNELSRVDKYILLPECTEVTFDTKNVIDDGSYYVDSGWAIPEGTYEFTIVVGEMDLVDKNSPSIKCVGTRTNLTDIASFSYVGDYPRVTTVKLSRSANSLTDHVRIVYNGNQIIPARIIQVCRIER